MDHKEEDMFFFSATSPGKKVLQSNKIKESYKIHAHGFQERVMLGGGEEVVFFERLYIEYLVCFF